MRLVAKTKEEVCKKPFDFYSFGHVIMGIVLFIISALISFALTNRFVLTMTIGLITCFIGGISWEIIENVFLIKINLKHDSRRDSWENSMADQILVAIGGIIEIFIFNTVNVIAITIINVLIVAILLWLYFKTKKLFLRKCK